MGQITLVISDLAETYLRGKNRTRGDMGKYVSQLLEAEAAKEAK
jgi:hypothetical protein